MQIISVYNVSFKYIWEDESTVTPMESVIDHEISSAQSPVFSWRNIVLELHDCACKLKLINRNKNDIKFNLPIFKGS